MPLIYYILRRNPETQQVEWVVDTSASQTVLLLSPTSTPATTFATDASSNNHILTVAGDTKPVEFNPYLSNYSAYFDGTGDALRIAGSSLPTELQIGLGNFTIEAWVYTTGTAFSALCGNLINGNGTVHFGVYLNSTYTGLSTIAVNAGQGIYFKFGTAVLETNSWKHIAITRSGTDLKCFLDGVQLGTTQTVANFATAVNNSFTIGATTDNTGVLSGYISNLRIVNGTAVYTANFTPPTSPLTAIAGTALLTCQSNRFVDNSPNTFAITKVGDVSITPMTPFASAVGVTGSSYFDGNGDILVIDDPMISTSDFTIECWIYMTEPPKDGNVTTLPGVQAIALSGVGAYSNNVNDHNWLFFIGATTVYFGKSPNLVTASNSLLPVFQWNHIAVTIVGSTGKLYINGVLSATNNSMTALGTTTSYTTKIGTGLFGNSAGFSSYFKGYISNFRIVKGTAVYTANFTPPTALTSIAGTALLTCQSNQQTNNSRFVNNAVSTSNLPVLRFGNVTQGAASPYGSSWSNYFDGTGDYLTYPSNGAFTFGTADFTVEAWVYVTAATNFGIFNVGGAATGSYSLYWLASTQKFTSTRYGDTGGAGNTTNTYPTNTWYHVAAVRSGSTAKLYINGVEDTGATYAIGNITANAGESGRVWQAASVTQGYISNLRVVKGTAVYTANFTPSTAPLTAITNTSLLTCQSNRFVDNSPNTFAITKVGDTRVQQFSPFDNQMPAITNYSSYFNGTNSGMTIAASTNLAPLTGDFTYECWVYPTSSDTTYRLLFGLESYSASAPFRLYQYGTAFQFWYTTNTSIVSPTISINTWYHLAITRSSETIKFFVNGVQAGSNVVSAVSYPSSLFRIGINSSPLYPFSGYMSDLRVVRGTAVYTANFTPPTSPLTAIPGTGLLTCQDSTLLDKSSNAFALTQAGDVRPTMFSPFANTLAAAQSYLASVHGGSAYFDGAGDYLTVADSDTLRPGSRPWTVEFWCNPNTVVGTQMLYMKGNGLQFYLSAASLAVALSSANTTTYFVNFTTIGTVVARQWNHIVLTFTGTVYYGFVNGIRTTIATSTTAVNAGTGASNPTAVGASPTGTLPVTGFITDVRFTNGIAVYTSNFAPPIAPLTSLTNTSLLLSMTSGAIVDTAGKNNIETVGDTKINTQIVKYGNSSIYFDGATDYLTISNPLENLRSWWLGSYTVETWVYATVLTSDATYGSPLIGHNSVTTANQAYWTFGPIADGTVRFFYWNGTAQSFTTTTTIALNQWNHIAFVKNGSALTIYINGVSSATSTVVGTPQSAVTLPLVVGAVNSKYFNGYISDLRITNGARYITDNLYSNVVLLLKMNGTNGSQTFLDEKNHAVTVLDNAVLTTTNKKFGTASLSSNSATASAVRVDLTSDINFTNTDWTIECWSYNSGVFTSLVGISQASADFNWFMYIYATGRIGFGINGTNEFTSGSNIATLNSWNHIAAVKTSNTLNIYCNGLLFATTTSASTYINASSRPLSVYATQNCFIDEVRVTKSIRYSAAFSASVPVSEFPTVGGFTPPTTSLPSI